MRPSFKHYIYRQFFSISLITIISLIVFVELISEDLEENMTALAIKSEKEHYQTLTDDITQVWKTATTIAAFVPEKIEHFSDLPIIFHGLPVPFSGEIEMAQGDYWIDISQIPNGVLYIANSTTLFEKHEKMFLVGIIIVGLTFIVISFFLAQLSARRIVKPLSALTYEVGSITPSNKSVHISENYRDQELYSIATTFNTYLKNMEEHVKREQLLISMASHELRTPIAVVSGALDILDGRGTLSAEDKKTVHRVRDATNEMSANVEAILMLARKQSASIKKKRIIFDEILLSAVQERLETHPEDQSRLIIAPSKFNHELESDATQVKMLLRNLIQNALVHTQGLVTLLQNEQGLLISDEGTGLPVNVRLQISQDNHIPQDQVNESGVGLFIVKLICERLGWSMDVHDTIATGTRIQLRINN